jgi:hypothetical protein
VLYACVQYLFRLVFFIQNFDTCLHLSSENPVRGVEMVIRRRAREARAAAKIFFLPCFLFVLLIRQIYPGTCCWRFARAASYSETGRFCGVRLTRAALFALFLGL